MWQWISYISPSCTTTSLDIIFRGSHLGQTRLRSHFDLSGVNAMCQIKQDRGVKRHTGDGQPPLSPKADHSSEMPGVTLRAPTSAATPILSHLESIRTEAECAVSGHDASVAAMQLVTGWQEFCGRRESERKSLREREKHVNCFLISLPLKALPCHQRKDVPASTDSCEPEAGINSTPWGWNQKGAPHREKEMKLEEIPNLSAENSMRKEKGFVWRPAEAFSNYSWSSVLKIQSTCHKRVVHNCY